MSEHDVDANPDGVIMRLTSHSLRYLSTRIRSASTPRRAFTLVELLVVIGIIALLISILLPALSKARESANQAKCLAQQRQITQAMILHANDHRGYMPMAGLPWTPGNATNPDALNDPRRQKYEYYGSGTGFLLSSVAAGVGKYAGQTMDFTSLKSITASMNEGVVRKLFNCPSDKSGGRYGTTVLNGGPHWSSYGFNEGPLGWCDPGSSGGVYGHSRLRGNTALFPHTSQLMLFADAAPRAGAFHIDDPNSWMLFNDSDKDATMADWWRGTLNPAPAHKSTGDPTLIDKFRHRNKINIAFADGHCQTYELSDDLVKVSITLDFPVIK